MGLVRGAFLRDTLTSPGAKEPFVRWRGPRATRAD